LGKNKKKRESVRKKQWFWNFQGNIIGQITQINRRKQGSRNILDADIGCLLFPSQPVSSHVVKIRKINFEVVIQIGLITPAVVHTVIIQPSLDKQA
jgi:hypothetical protein